MGKFKRAEENVGHDLNSREAPLWRNECRRELGTGLIWSLK
jgi:hypothetical protein